MQARALVVDDNETNVAVIEFALKALGFETDVALNGREAVERLQASSYQVAFIDYHMPVMDGADLVRWMAANMTDRPFAIIVTADARSETRTLFESLGVDGFLTKPVSIPALVAALTALQQDDETPDDGDEGA